MQDAELFGFMAIFREMLKVFPKSRAGEDDIDPMARSYFRALQRFTIAEIQAGADAWIQRGKFFPKPAEWRESIPKRRAPGVEALVPLASAEAAEYLDAERRKWEGEPCACRRCQGAGVTHRFTRYVPEEDEYGRSLRGLIGDRVVVRGQWLHSDDLRRWYEARDAFEVFKARVIAAKKMPKVSRAECEPSPYASVVEAS